MSEPSDAASIPDRRARIALLLTVFGEFARVGATAFGGGSATISALRRLCLRREWLTEEEFFDTLVLSRITPGTTIIAQIYLIGRRICGTPGLIAAAVGLLAPAFTVTLALARLYLALDGSTGFEGPLAIVSAVAAGFALALAVELLLDCLSRTRRVRGAAWVAVYAGFAYLINNSTIVIVAALVVGACVPRAFGQAVHDDP